MHIILIGLDLNRIWLTNLEILEQIKSLVSKPSWNSFIRWIIFESYPIGKCLLPVYKMEYFTDLSLNKEIITRWKATHQHDVSVK